MNQVHPSSCQIFLSQSDRASDRNREADKAGYLWVSSGASTWLIGYQQDYVIWTMIRFLYPSQPWRLQKQRFQQIEGEAYHTLLEKLKNNGVDLLRLCNTTLSDELLGEAHHGSAGDQV